MPRRSRIDADGALQHVMVRVKFRGHNTKLLISPFIPWTIRSGFFPELFSQQHLKFINAQMTPKRPAGSFMLTEFLMFFLLKFVFKKLSIVSPDYLSPELSELYCLHLKSMYLINKSVPKQILGNFKIMPRLEI